MCSCEISNRFYIGIWIQRNKNTIISINQKCCPFRENSKYYDSIFFVLYFSNKTCASLFFFLRFFAKPSILRIWIIFDVTKSNVSWHIVINSTRYAQYNLYCITLVYLPVRIDRSSPYISKSNSQTFWLCLFLFFPSNLLKTYI